MACEKAQTSCRSNGRADVVARGLSRTSPLFGTLVDKPSGKYEMPPWAPGSLRSLYNDFALDLSGTDLTDSLLIDSLEVCARLANGQIMQAVWTELSKTNGYFADLPFVMAGECL